MGLQRITVLGRIMEVEVHRLTRPRKASWSVAPEIASFQKQKKACRPFGFAIL
jgi:hypothetical protein